MNAMSGRHSPPGWVVAGSVATLAVLCSGCWQNLPPGKVRVHGIVMLDGRPLTHDQAGMFSINLASHESANGAAARIDQRDGSFALVIEPGDYIASVIATDGYDKDEPARGRVVPARSLIPRKYNTLATSDVAVTVPRSGGKISVSLVSEQAQN